MAKPPVDPGWFEPGPLAEGMKVNGIAICVCGNNTFFNLCRITPPDENILVVTHCTECHTEAPVPLDPPKDPDRFKIFDPKIPDPRDFN